MIRSKAALIEALENTGARLHTGETFRSYVSSPGKESQPVHAGAIKALHDNLVTVEDPAAGETYRLHWIDAPDAPAVAAVATNGDTNAQAEAYAVAVGFPADPDKFTKAVDVVAADWGVPARMLTGYDLGSDGDETMLIAGRAGRGLTTPIVEIDGMKLANGDYTPEQLREALKRQGQDRAETRMADSSPGTLLYSMNEGLTFNKLHHVDPNTGRVAMTIEQAAKHVLQEGERMHMYSKVKAANGRDPWNRVGVVMVLDGKLGARLQWFNAGWCSLAKDRIIYVGA